MVKGVLAVFEFVLEKRFQDSRPPPQIQEETVLKEIAAREERSCRTFKFFSFIFVCKTDLYLFKFSRKFYYFSRVTGGRA